MQEAQLNRALELINRTGDKLVVLDKNSDQMIVMMDVAGYEGLLNSSGSIKDLNEQEMINKINRDISVWSANQDLPDGDPMPWEDQSEAGSAFSFEEDTLNRQDFGSEMPTVSGFSSEESLADIPHEEEEEDKFYLEPIE